VLTRTSQQPSAAQATQLVEAAARKVLGTELAARHERSELVGFAEDVSLLRQRGALEQRGDGVARKRRTLALFEHHGAPAQLAGDERTLLDLIPG
jgi:hypothetical protein